MNIAAGLSGAALSLWPVVRRLIMDRIQAFEAGRARAPEWVNRRLREIDPQLQLRWDFNEQSWVVDRYTRPLRSWHPVLIWRDTAGPRQLDQALFDTLHEGDTWRYGSPAKYLEHKRAVGEARRKANEKRADDRILEAVDNLSSRQQQEFIAVEQALRTGETIIAHGPMEKSLERMEAAAMRAARAGELYLPVGAPINPGHHPSIIRETQRRE